MFAIHKYQMSLCFIIQNCIVYLEDPPILAKKITSAWILTPCVVWWYECGEFSRTESSFEIGNTNMYISVTDSLSHSLRYCSESRSKKKKHYLHHTHSHRWVEQFKATDLFLIQIILFIVLNWICIRWPTYKNRLKLWFVDK